MPPRFPPKPPAHSAHPVLGPAIERSRRLGRDEVPRNSTELVEDIARNLKLPKEVLDLMRERARRDDG